MRSRSPSGDTAAAPGATGVAISITVDDAAGIAGASLTLTYDASALTARQVQTTALTSGFSLVPNLNTAGQVKAVLASATGISSGKGALVTVTFDVKSDAKTGVYTLTLSRAEFESVDRALPVQGIVKGAITITDGIPPSSTMALDLNVNPGDQKQWQAASISRVGDKVTVEIVAVSGAEGILGYQAVLSFDPNQLKFNDFEMAGLISGLSMKQTPEPGKVELSAVTTGAGSAADSGTLGRVTFEAFAGFSGETQVALVSASYANPDGSTRALQIGVEGSKVTVAGAVKKTPDFNGDGEVAFSDFIEFAKNFGKTV